MPQMPEMAPQSGNMQFRRKVRSMRQRTTSHNDTRSDKIGTMGKEHERGRNKQRMTS